MFKIHDNIMYANVFKPADYQVRTLPTYYFTH